MYNFFVDKNNFKDGFFNVSGADFNHIKNVLRLKVGDNVLICSDGVNNLCSIDNFSSDTVTLKVLQENYMDTALPITVTLFQGLPKSDKMELIIQKAVELGADKIVPVEMERCVVKLDSKKKDGKTSRWQAIAESAAKQSKRTSIPTVESPLNFEEMLKKAQTCDVFLVPYENKDGMSATASALNKIKRGNSVGVLIGPEGGFSEKEIERAIAIGGIPVSLGRRILRTETAAITALSMIMLHAEINL